MKSLKESCGFFSFLEGDGKVPYFGVRPKENYPCSLYLYCLIYIGLGSRDERIANIIFAAKCPSAQVYF